MFVDLCARDRSRRKWSWNSASAQSSVDSSSKYRPGHPQLNACHQVEHLRSVWSERHVAFVFGVGWRRREVPKCAAEKTAYAPSRRRSNPAARRRLELNPFVTRSIQLAEPDQPVVEWLDELTTRMRNEAEAGAVPSPESISVREFLRCSATSDADKES